MTAAMKLTPEEREIAPRIWKTVGPDMRVKVIDYDWVLSRRGLPTGSQLHDTAPPVPTIAPKLVNEYRSLIGRSAQIIARIADLHGVSVKELVGDSRLRKFVLARQHAAYELCRRGKTLPEVGRLLGDRDHTTILHAARVWPKKAEGIGMAVNLEDEA